MARRRSGVPEWLVERLAAGDLDPAQANAVRARLDEAGTLDRLDAIRSSNLRILTEHPPSEVVREIQRRLATPSAARRRTRKCWSLAAPGLVIAGAAALSALVLLVGPGAPPKGAEDATAPADTVRLKGLEPHLVAYKKTSSGALRLGRAHRVAPGDLIQVAYVAAGRGYGVVASIDSAGTVTMHLPEQHGTAVPLASRGETALPHAFELDDVPGRERFVFVTGDQPFSTRALVDFLTGDKSLPRGLEVTELSLEKNQP